MDVGGHGDPTFDYGCGDRSGHRSARQGSSQLISSCSKRRKPRRQPIYKEIRARLAARASELRVRITKSWRAWCQPRRPTPALPTFSRAIGCRQLKES
eukprot:3660162-Pleurochrysis_carterae.AAC.1